MVSIVAARAQAPTTTTTRGPFSGLKNEKKCISRVKKEEDFDSFNKNKPVFEPKLTGKQLSKTVRAPSPDGDVLPSDSDTRLRTEEKQSLVGDMAEPMDSSPESTPHRPSSMSFLELHTRSSPKSSTERKGQSQSHSEADRGNFSGSSPLKTLRCASIEGTADTFAASDRDAQRPDCTRLAFPVVALTSASPACRFPSLFCNAKNSTPQASTSFGTAFFPTAGRQPHGDGTIATTAGLSLQQDVVQSRRSPAESDLGGQFVDAEKENNDDRVGYDRRGIGISKSENVGRWISSLDETVAAAAAGNSEAKTPDRETSLSPPRKERPPKLPFTPGPSAAAGGCYGDDDDSLIFSPNPSSGDDDNKLLVGWSFIASPKLGKETPSFSVVTAFAEKLRLQDERG